MARTANVDAPATNGEIKERVSLSSIVNNEFDAVIKLYCADTKTERADLVRRAVADYLNERTSPAGQKYTIDPEWLEAASRKEAAARAGLTRSARNKELTRKATAADAFQQFLLSNNPELAAQFQAFLEGNAGQATVEDDEEDAAE